MTELGQYRSDELGLSLQYINYQFTKNDNYPVLPHIVGVEPYGDIAAAVDVVNHTYSRKRGVISFEIHGDQSMPENSTFTLASRGLVRTEVNDGPANYANVNEELRRQIARIYGQRVIATALGLSLKELSPEIRDSLGYAEEARRAILFGDTSLVLEQVH